MEIWITGAAGRIGTILRKHWQGKHTVIGIDHHEYDPLPGEEAYVADIGSTELWTLLATKGSGGRVLEGAKRGQYDTAVPIALVHLAAVTSDTADWVAIEQTNIRGTYNVFSLARQCGIRKVLFASSNHVTGGYEALGIGNQSYEPPLVTITPEMPIRPDSLYAVSKVTGEILGSYFSRHGVPIICLRIGSVTDRDDPVENPRLRSTWLSHRDLCHLFDCCLTADVPYGIYYGVSNNTQRFWDISNAERELEYRPQDNAELWYKKEGDNHGKPS